MHKIFVGNNEWIEGIKNIGNASVVYFPNLLASAPHENLETLYSLILEQISSSDNVSLTALASMNN